MDAISINGQSDGLVSQAEVGQGEIRKLRAILLDCGLDRGMKWGKEAAVRSRQAAIRDGVVEDVPAD
jgi:hypothetical protein